MYEVGKSTPLITKSAQRLIKQTIMKYPYLTMIVGVLALGGATIGILNNFPYIEETDQSTYMGIETEEVEESVEEVDMIEAATAELERLNAELDAESTRLLEEKAAVEAKAAVDVAEIESRLERIRETRASFQ